MRFAVDVDSAADSDPENALLPQQRLYLMFMLKLQEEKMKSPEQRASLTMINTRADFGAAIEI